MRTRAAGAKVTAMETLTALVPPRPDVHRTGPWTWTQHWTPCASRDKSENITWHTNACFQPETNQGFERTRSLARGGARPASLGPPPPRQPQVELDVQYVGSWQLVDNFAWPATDVINIQVALGREKIPQPCRDQTGWGALRQGPAETRKAGKLGAGDPTPCHPEWLSWEAPLDPMYPFTQPAVARSQSSVEAPALRTESRGDVPRRQRATSLPEPRTCLSATPPRSSLLNE